MTPNRKSCTILRRLLSVAGMAVSLALILGLIAVAVGRLVFHLGLSPVLTGSMVPTFSPGDAVISRPVPVSRLHPGQIVVVTPPGSAAPFAHRVATVSAGQSLPVITTKGDANPTADAWHLQLLRPKVQVVVGSVPTVGRWLLVLHDPRVRAAVTALFGIMLTAVAAWLALGDLSWTPPDQAPATS
jgi:signal peptidase